MGEHSGCRLVIADDSAYIRSWLRNLLEAGSEFIVAGEASQWGEMSEQVKKLAPDALIIDLHLPGLDIQQAVKRLNGGPRLIFFDGVRDEHDLKGIDDLQAVFTLQPLAPAQLHCG